MYTVIYNGDYSISKIIWQNILDPILNELASCGSNRDRNATNKKNSRNRVSYFCEKGKVSKGLFLTCTFVLSMEFSVQYQELNSKVNVNHRTHSKKQTTVSKYRNEPYLLKTHSSDSTFKLEICIVNRFLDLRTCIQFN